MPSKGSPQSPQRGWNWSHTIKPDPVFSTRMDFMDEVDLMDLMDRVLTLSIRDDCKSKTVF